MIFCWGVCYDKDIDFVYVAVVGNLYIFIHCARYTMRNKRPFRLYCRRTSILREVSSDSSVSVRFLRQT